MIVNARRVDLIKDGITRLMTHDLIRTDIMLLKVLLCYFSYTDVVKFVYIVGKFNLKQTCRSYMYVLATLFRCPIVINVLVDPSLEMRRSMRTQIIKIIKVLYHRKRYNG